MKKRILLRTFFGFFILLFFQEKPAISQALASLPSYRNPSAPVQSRSVKVALQELENKFKVYFNYNDRVLKNKQTNVRLTEVSNLEDALKLLLEPIHLKYEKVGEKYYSIFEKNQSKPTQENLKKKLSIEGTDQILPDVSSQEAVRSKEKIAFPVTGKVTSAINEGIPGVNVLLKGTSTGTTTNADGDYTLSVPNGNDTLIFSYIGYMTKEVPISNRAIINITLESDVKSLNEVVVVGYGTVKKSDLTGSVVSLKSEDLNKGLNISLEQSLQGRAPGVQITQSSAEPGGAVSVRIRGSGSINAGNEPLYVVDGLPIDNVPAVSTVVGTNGNPPPRNPLNSLNPSDIESIEILKDASATAIYGSRGANGVVLITTKRGKDGKLVVNYNTSHSLSQIARKVDVLTTGEYIQVMNELEVARGNKVLFSPADIQSVGSGTDWQDAVLRRAYSQVHDLSFSGGTKNTQFYTSFNFTDQQGIVTNSNFKRYQGRLNLTHRADDKFRFGLNLNTSFIKDAYVPTNALFINRASDIITSAINNPPVFPVYNNDGTFYDPESGQLVSVTLPNPVSMIYGEEIGEETNRTFGSFFLEYELLPKLNAKLNLGSDRSASRRDIYRGRQTVNGNAVGGNATIGTGELTNTLAEFTLNYNTTINQKHSLNILAGSTFQAFRNRTTLMSANGFASDIIQTNNIGTGNQKSYTIGSNRNDRRLISYLARANYNFAGKYLFTGTIRADGSSNFGENNRFGFFPSVSAAWKISEESLFKDSRHLSELKLRIGWGQIGNDNIGNGNALATYAANGDQFTSGAILGNQINTAITAVRIPNPDLKWETTEQINIGLDAGFFAGRIYTSIDYFNKTTKDLLLALPIPSATGFSTIISNVGEVKNSGIEFLIRSKNLTGNLGWSTAFNFSTLNNKVVSLGPLKEIIVGAQGANALLRPGVPMFSYYGFEASGIFQTRDEVMNSAQRATASPGGARWNDVNGDGRIDGADRVVLGNPYPDVILGLSNEFSYKNFNFNFFFEATFGQDLLYYGLFEAINPNDPFRNRLAEPLINRWTPENPTNKWPSAINPASYQGGETNSFTVTDASFIRLKNVQLSYRFPFRIPKISNLSVFVTAQNLALITKYPGYDPDTNSTGSSNVRLDRGAYPAARTYTFGLNLNF